MPNYFQSTSDFVPMPSSFLQNQPPSWSDVQPNEVSRRKNEDNQLNDAFSGMTMFDANEVPKPIQTQPQQQYYCQPDYSNYNNPRKAEVDFYQQCYQKHIQSTYQQLLLQNQHPIQIPTETVPVFSISPPISSSIYSSSLSSSNSSSFENIPSAISPVEHNGTIYFSNPNSGEMSCRDMYFFLSKQFQATRKALIESGYPYFEFGKENEIIWIEKNDKIRNCCRCRIEFKFNKNGKRSIGNCTYHPRSAKFNLEFKFRIHDCCGEIEGQSKGCEIAQYHVYDQILTDELEKFLATPKSIGLKDIRNYNIFGIDCEMVYTLGGPAIARVSIIDLAENIVLDVIVKPPTKTLDANTTFSGLTIEQVEQSTVSIEACRQKMFELINEKTILIGHSLESDLKALRISHMKIIDTAILFQKQGSKFKPSLRNLAQQYLNKSIQMDNPSNIGHDSIEDAKTCIQLINHLSTNC
ncbi:unnamed protein product [Caenorhabditis angaria]|uniref:Exonuclease domain-containing protein n=1 Tax=Caenorhabditis angaria TaxID=860376 RepID=A0A9P1N8G0_9PELO|nr:unnamed protein product [Caenorhabditis angaria]